METPKKIKIICPGCRGVNEVELKYFSRFYCEHCGRLIKGRIPINIESKANKNAEEI